MRRPAALGLVGWTLFVWATRIANVWRDEALDTGEKWGRTALAASLTFLAVAVLVALVVRSGPAIRATVGVLAGWTVAVWVVRDVRIVLADHGLGFTVVHVVLGVVSIVLAVLAWREDRRLAAASTAPAVPAGSAP
jgi:hypothetical protein